MALALVLLTVFVVFCGRATSAAIDVHAAAGARAAADATTPAGAVRAEAPSVKWGL